MHRDIKPANIIITANCEFKLIDYGNLRKIKSMETYLHTFTGSPIYMSKEMIKGKYSYGSDYWSLGMVIYEL